MNPFYLTQNWIAADELDSLRKAKKQYPDAADSDLVCKSFTLFAMSEHLTSDTAAKWIAQNIPYLYKGRKLVPVGEMSPVGSMDSEILDEWQRKVAEKLRKKGGSVIYVFDESLPGDLDVLSSVELCKLRKLLIIQAA